MQKELTIQVSADTTQWEILHQKLTDFYVSCFHDCPALRKLLIAAEELFVNSAQYAYDDTVEKARQLVDIHAVYDSDKQLASICIIDGGKEYNPLMHTLPDTSLSLDKRPIGGLGILMIKKIADQFTYERLDNQNHNTIQKTLA